VGQDGRAGSPIADKVTGTLRGLTQHLGAQVLLGILERKFLGNGDPIVANQRRTPFLLNQHGLRLGAECHADGIGKLGRASQHLFARRRPEHDVLVGHRSLRAKNLRFF
jgi:hypothetical protein